MVWYMLLLSYQQCRIFYTSMIINTTNANTKNVKYII